MSKLGDMLRKKVEARAGAKPDYAASLAHAAHPAPSAKTETRRIPTRGTEEWYRLKAGMGVSDGPELQRVLALPRRKPFAAHRPEELDTLVVEETARYRRPGGTMTLRPIQAFALREIRTKGGMLGPIAVGGGKTIISLLAPMALGAKRPLLLVPPNLVSKLHDVDYPNLAGHWHLPYLVGHDVAYADQVTHLNVLAYSTLSTDAGADALERLQPDVIIADEGHTLAPLARSARSDRFRRYLRSHPDTRLVILSGTLMSRTIRQGARLGAWALGTGSPFPTDANTTEEWAMALDFEEGEAADPGALVALCAAGESPQRAFARRVAETPGVVATAEAFRDVRLNIHARPVDLAPAVRTALEDLRHTWVTPSGEEITDDLSFSRAARQLACGFYYRWSWPKAVTEASRQEWLDARKAWNREVRSFLTYRSRKGIDSEARYEAAVRAGTVASGTYEAWCAARESIPEPSQEAVWVDDFLARDAVAWGRKHTGIIWYSHVALGKRIAELGGYPLFGGGDYAASAILREVGNRTIVAGVRPHGEGKDLTAWNTQLVTTPSSANQTWEQLLGRQHRYGQRASAVNTWVYAHTPEMSDALARAVKNAAWTKRLNNGADQRLLYAHFTFTPRLARR